MDASSPLAITGWLKKEADKGLKVGNLIKKPFNDRYFVLDTKEKRLCYYEKEQSDTPNGFVDLANVTKITKSGKHECEFLIEFIDGGSTTKTYTLQAPSVPKMDLWIKAINIVRETTKFKHIGTGTSGSNGASSPSPLTPHTTSESSSSGSKSTTTATVNSASSSDTSFKTALELKSTSPSGAKSSASPSAASPSSASFPKRASLVPSAASSKAPNSTEVPRASTNSFLGAQRSSMYSGAPPKHASPSGVSARAAAFESGAAKQSTAPNRWSTSKSPNSKASTTSHHPPSNVALTIASPAPPSGSPSPTTALPPNSSTSAAWSNHTPDTSAPPPSLAPNATQSSAVSPGDVAVATELSSHLPETSNVQSSTIDPPSPSTQAEPISPPSEVATDVKLNNSNQEAPSGDEDGELDSLLAPLLLSSSVPTVALSHPSGHITSGSHRQSFRAVAVPTPSEDTFQLGDQSVVLRSSLSSLAPQQMGAPLLSEAEFVSTSSPVIKPNSLSSDSQTLKMSIGSLRDRPKVPSPLTLLEESIRSSTGYESPHTIQTETLSLKEGEELVETPDRLISIIQLSKSHLDEEYRLRLNNWSLVGVKGVWVMQSAIGMEVESEDDPYDPETSYTWHLPGFIQVRWHGHNHWHVSTRDLSSADEISWDLASIGRKLSSLDSVIPVPRQALIYHLYATVHKILSLPSVATTRNAYEVPLEQKAESLSDPQLEKLIRSDLCTRIAAVMLDGFNDWSILRKYHIWDFIHDSALGKTNFWSVGSVHLPLTVRDIALSSADPNIRFRNFINMAIGNRQLYAWMAELLSNQTEVSDYFDDISLIRQLPTMFLHALAPLSNVMVQLPLENPFPNGS